MHIMHGRAKLQDELGKLGLGNQQVKAEGAKYKTRKLTAAQEKVAKEKAAIKAKNYNAETTMEAAERAEFEKATIYNPDIPLVYQRDESVKPGEDQIVLGELADGSTVRVHIVGKDYVIPENKGPGLVSYVRSWWPWK